MLVQWNGTENNIKVVLMGESGVGKSSIVSRFVSERYDPYMESTVGAAYLTNTIPLEPESISPECECERKTDRKSILKRKKCAACSAGNATVTFKIWDTSGQEKFQSLMPMYYRGAGAAIFVFDLSKHQSIHSIRKWVQEVKRCGPPGIFLVLCGNKSDLSGDRRIDYVTARALALEIGAFYVETSAKEGVNVQDMFQEVARRAAAEDEAAISLGICSCSDSRSMTGLEVWEDMLISFDAVMCRTWCVV